MVSEINHYELYSLNVKNLKRKLIFFFFVQLLLIGGIILYLGFDSRYLFIISSAIILLVTATLLYVKAPHWIVFCNILLVALPAYRFLSIRSIDWMGLGLTLSVLFSWFLDGNSQFWLKRIDLYIVLYLCLILISGLASGNLNPNSRITLYGFITFFAARSFIKNNKQLRIAFLLIPIYGLLLILQMAAGFARHHPELLTFSFSRKEADVSWGSTNYLAALLVLVIPLTLSLFFTVRKIRWKILLFALITTMIIGVFWTVSRTGALCLGIIVITWLLNLNKRKVLVLLAVLLMAYLLLIPFINKVESRFSSHDVASYLSALERYNLWEGSWKIFKQNPLIGVGMYNAEVVTFLKSRSTDPHNLVLKSLAETGIIGFILLLLIFQELFRKVFLFRKRIKGTSTDRIIYTGFLATLSVSVFNRMLEVIGDRYEILFWFIMGLLFLMVESKSRDSSVVSIEARK
ncbi:MAG TPA: O-antigen ligase family protein [Terriglobales bacterium]|nr:O-antigen ligase family protein [Terriglobales bacterium]